MAESMIELVVYCLIRRKEKDKTVYFMKKENSDWTFPYITLQKNEDLYHAVGRLLENELNLKTGSYFIETELPMQCVKKPFRGLSDYWYLYPVDLSLDSSKGSSIEDLNHLTENGQYTWKSIDAINTNEEKMFSIIKELKQFSQKPNLKKMSEHEEKSKPTKKSIHEQFHDLLSKTHEQPSMEALASRWAAEQNNGVRVIGKKEIDDILSAGSRAFNLRVADPYLPYQKQGLGFTWSFFTYKDRQDVHVHGLPAVEIYGVIDGKFMLWFKPMNQRGASAWRNVLLCSGDWVEVEPLHCHFGCWVNEKGTGVVIKAAGTGELAGVGKIGEKGKTTCKDCNVQQQCCKHPGMIELEKEYQQENFTKRDWRKIKDLVKECNQQPNDEWQDKSISEKEIYR